MANASIVDCRRVIRGNLHRCEPCARGSRTLSTLPPDPAARASYLTRSDTPPGEQLDDGIRGNLAFGGFARSDSPIFGEVQKDGLIPLSVCTVLTPLAASYLTRSDSPPGGSVG